MTHIVGIDEAGRGPVAGPVAVGGVRIPLHFEKRFFKGIKDSKQLTAEERELWFSLASVAKKKQELDFTVSLVSEKVIDKKGIAYAIRLGIKRVLKNLKISEESQIFLDGGIKAPAEFKHQLSVIRGDEKVPVISLASICAKVVRDRRMVKLARKYPEYNFDSHMGYATAGHRRAILEHGPVELHRRSFLTRLT